MTHKQATTLGVITVVTGSLALVAGALTLATGVVAVVKAR